MKKKYYQSIEDDIKITHNAGSSNAMEVPHFHDHFELHFTLSYNLKFIINNKIFHAPKGSVFAIEPKVPHMTVIPDETWFERYTVYIKPEILQKINIHEEIDLKWLFQTNNVFPACHIILKKEDIHEFQGMLNKAMIILESDLYYANAYRLTIISEILLYLACKIHDKGTYKSEACEDEKSILAKKIMDFISNNITLDINLDMLEREFYTNKYSICNIFKEYCGFTVNQYITSRRIYLACEILKNNPPVYKVCEMSGFSDYGHFIRTFKKHVGITPKQYALQLQEKNIKNNTEDIKTLSVN